MFTFLYCAFENFKNSRSVFSILFIFMSLLCFTNVISDTIYSSSHLTSEKFYESFVSTSTTNTLQFNTSDEYKFIQNRNIQAAPNNQYYNFMFKRSDKLTNKLLIKNFQLSGFDEIRIYIRHKVQLEFENCVFQFTGNKGIVIYFDNDSLTSNGIENMGYIKFTNCKFINNCRNLSNESSYQLKFKRDKYPADSDGSFKINNIFVQNSKFLIMDYPENNSKSFNSIIINRMHESDYISNISIENNKFEYKNMNDAHTGGIIIQNANPGCNYSTNEFYQYNKTISINNNHISTDSHIPAQAIFVQGPFDSLEICQNIVSGFSGIIRNQNLAIPDGDIHLYGARGSSHSYSDDNRNITIKNNIIYSRGIGIKVSGGKNVEIAKNIIYMLPLPRYWRNDNSSDLIRTGRFAISTGTGDADDPRKQSNNLRIVKNNIYGEIDLNGNTHITENCGGIILFSPRDFIVKYNFISETNNYGIIYFKHSSQTEQSFGRSIISQNLIDYKNQYNTNLKSTFYSNYNNRYAAVNIQRKFHKLQKKIFDEELTIENNIVLSVDRAIQEVVFEPGRQEKISRKNKYNIR